MANQEINIYCIKDCEGLHHYVGSILTGTTGRATLFNIKICFTNYETLEKSRTYLSYDRHGYNLQQNMW